MNEISPQQLLNQIRALNAEITAPSPAVVDSAPDSGFGDLLRNSIDGVSDSQNTAQALKHAFETGTGDASLAEVMIASQKADLSFRAMTEVRNKLVTAYQEIMNMPV